MSDRVTRNCAAPLGLAVVFCGSVAKATLPMSGAYVPALQEVDTLFQTFVEANGIPGANVAITHNNAVVYERGFGYSDLDQTAPIAENALMRLASLTKPVTASAIHQLYNDGMLNMDDKVFNIAGNGGILDIAPFGGVLGDARLDDITVANLLEHRGGWDRDIVGDLAFRDIVIADAMGVPSPPGIDNTARYILSQPLQFAPDDRRAYSNVGYMFLGMVVEEVSGQPYETYVDESVLAPAGIPAWEVNAGRTFAEDQNPREPAYSHDYTTASVFDPSETVSWPYGGWDLEKKIAYGGLIGSAKALANLARDRIVAGPEIGTRREDYTTYTSYWWYHTGSLAGTNTLVLQASWGEWTYAILFNRRPTDGSSYTGALVDPLNDALGAIDTWPQPLDYQGDFSGDQWLTADDIELFDLAVRLGSPTEFENRFPSARYLAGDFDGDGAVSWSDGPGFLTALLDAGVPQELLARWPGAQGDYNGDGFVNAADYTIWRDNFGSPSGTLPNDITGVEVGQVQFDFWAANYRSSLPTASFAAPEPSAVVLAASAICGLARRRQDAAWQRWSHPRGRRESNFTAFASRTR